MKIAVYIKTHLWDDNIKEFVYKISNECKSNQNIDFFLLAQVNIEKQIPEDIKKFTKIYTSNNIQQFYKEGFLSLWLSNHIITQWFFYNYGKDYDYIWSVEYDVRIIGDSNYIWNYKSNADLIIPSDLMKSNSKTAWDKTLDSHFKNIDRYKVLLQIHRISKKFINKLHELFSKGINGQDELIYGSVCKKYNFNYDTTFLKNIIGGIWHTSPIFSFHNKDIYNKLQKSNNSRIRIFHPIKSKSYNEKFNNDQIHINNDKISLKIKFNDIDNIEIDIEDKKIKIFDNINIQKVYINKNNNQKINKNIKNNKINKVSIKKINNNLKKKIKKITNKNKK